ncbi:MAG TPA: DMT family transporter [Phnomibacter sp.]|nr:DMT family transporter [Phnomibacter sp.]
MSTNQTNIPAGGLRKLMNWGIFFLLCLIWGSSFILMKLGMFDTSGKPLLSAFQVAALRILSAGLAMLPFARAAFKKLPDAKTRKLVSLSGLWGSFFPVFLFCLAESKIDSALAGVINAMTPLFTLLIGTLFYSAVIPGRKWMGIIIGFCGCLLLFFHSTQTLHATAYYGLYAVLATVFYGMNVNLVRNRLLHAPSLDIAAMAFVFLSIPALIVLLATGYFSLPLSTQPFVIATAASITLGVFGTAIASVLFYVLVKRTGIVFPSLVTYGIPFVAICWGVYFGEKVSPTQLLAMLIILMGVYLVNMKMPAPLRNAKKMLLRKQQHSKYNSKV